MHTDLFYADFVVLICCMVPSIVVIYVQSEGLPPDGIGKQRMFLLSFSELFP